MQYFLYTNLALPDSLQATIRPLKQLSKETELFPIPGTDGFPVLPQNTLLSFCQKAKKKPAFFVQSADYPLWNQSPVFISEQQALALATKQGAKLFHDSVSNSSYFCYQDATQHLVWIEDGFHLLKKLQFLQKNGIAQVAFPVYQRNVQTILSVIECLK